MAKTSIILWPAVMDANLLHDWPHWQLLPLHCFITNTLLVQHFSFTLAVFHHKYTALLQEHFNWSSLDTSLQFFFFLLYTTGTLRKAQAIPFCISSQPQNVLLKTLAYNTRLHGRKYKRVSWISTLIAVYSPCDRCSCKCYIPQSKLNKKHTA